MIKKIMFSDKYGLTQAVLEGRKTQTRRIINIDEEELTLFQTIYYNQAFDFLEGKDLIEAYFDNYPKKIPYKKGEIVAVAQSYEVVSDNISQTPSKEKAEFYCKIMKSCYPNEEIPRDKEDIAGWTNKMFIKAELMPHQIRITKVRIEKLQDISDDDCLAEGIEFDGKAQSFYCGMNVSTNAKTWLGHTPREAYASLIDKVGKKGDWESNPYVLVYEFKLVK